MIKGVLQVKINLKIIFILIIIMSIIIFIGINISSKPHLLNISNNNSSNLNQINNKLNQNSTINDNNSINIPSNDSIINNINWSRYPNLQMGYVHFAQECEPNDIVPHKYVAIGIITEVKNYDNRTLIYKQLSEIALEIRRMCGPNTAICVFGTNHGILEWTVSMRVYDDKIYY